jgi:hypothetical protein
MGFSELVKLFCEVKVENTIKCIRHTSQLKSIKESEIPRV